MKKMKNIGMLIFISGLVLLVCAFTMDTSVQVDYQYGNTMGLPDRVNNIGLMADKQNYLIFGVVLAVLGIVIVVTYDKKIEKEKNQKKCPQCAELVHEEAIICRFCGYGFEQDLGDDYQPHYALAKKFEASGLKAEAIKNYTIAMNILKNNPKGVDDKVYSVKNIIEEKINELSK